MLPTPLQTAPRVQPVREAAAQAQKGKGGCQVVGIPAGIYAGPPAADGSIPTSKSGCSAVRQRNAPTVRRSAPGERAGEHGGRELHALPAVLRGADGSITPASCFGDDGTEPFQQHDGGQPCGQPCFPRCWVGAVDRRSLGRGHWLGRGHRLDDERSGSQIARHIALLGATTRRDEPEHAADGTKHNSNSMNGAGTKSVAGGSISIGIGIGISISSIESMSDSRSIHSPDREHYGTETYLSLSLRVESSP